MSRYDLTDFERRVIAPLLPNKPRGVPRVDDLLARLTRRAGATYVRMSGLTLPYLDDELHLTEAGHRAFGDRIADAVDR